MPSSLAAPLSSSKAYRVRLEQLRGALVPTPARRAAAVAEAIASCRELAADLNADLERHAAQVPEQLTAPANIRAAHRAETAELGELAAEITLFLDAFEAQMASAGRQEDDAERRQIYDLAVEATDRTREALEGYPAAAAAILRILATLEAGEAAVARANAALPAGQKQLPSPQLASRQIAGTPERVVSREAMQLWCLASSPYPADQDAVRVKDGAGWIEHRGVVDRDGKIVPSRCVLRPFVKERGFAGVPHVYAPPLSDMLHLPGAFDTLPLWGAGHFESAATSLERLQDSIAKSTASGVAPATGAPFERLVPATEGEPGSPVEIAQGATLIAPPPPPPADLAA